MCARLVPRFIFSLSLFQTICQLLWMSMRLQMDSTCSLLYLVWVWIYPNRYCNEGGGRVRNQEVNGMHPSQSGGAAQANLWLHLVYNQFSPWGGRCPQNQTTTLKGKVSTSFLQFFWWVIACKSSKEWYWLKLVKMVRWAGSNEFCTRCTPCLAWKGSVTMIIRALQELYLNPFTTSSFRLVHYFFCWQLPNTYRPHLVSNRAPFICSGIFRFSGENQLLSWFLERERRISLFLFCNGYIIVEYCRRQRHTSYLSFFWHEQNFWRIKFTPKNA